MADPTPGVTTSEGKLTIFAVILGTVLEAAAGILHTLQDSGHAAPWFPAVLAVVGVLLQLASVLGYQKARTVLKATVVNAENSVPK